MIRRAARNGAILPMKPEDIPALRRARLRFGVFQDPTGRPARDGEARFPARHSLGRVGILALMVPLPGPAKKATIVSFQREQGFGKVAIEGEGELPFDAVVAQPPPE